jgi:hypothetical protein
MKDRIVCKECYLLGDLNPYYSLYCKKEGHKPREEETKKILVLPNGLETELYINMITDIIRLLTDDQVYNYHITFRIHPNKHWEKYTLLELDKIQNTFFNKNFLVFDNKTLFYEQLEKADFVIAGESTALIESISLGIDTIHYKTPRAIGHVDTGDIETYTSMTGLYERILGVLRR